MKKLLLLAIVALSSCGPSRKEDENNLDHRKDVTGIMMNNSSFQIVTVDSCEYVLYRKYEGGYSSFSSGITHKGNCKYCKQRNKK